MLVKKTNFIRDKTIGDKYAEVTFKRI